MTFQPTQQLNYRYVGIGRTHIGRLETNPAALEAHKRTVMHAMNRYLFPHEIESVLQTRRPSITRELLYHDLMLGDIPYHHVEKDIHYQRALAKVAQDFKPRRPARPVHFLDVYHHYPINRASNAEWPFAFEPKYRSWFPSSKRNLGEIYDLPEFKQTIRTWIHQIKEGDIVAPQMLGYNMIHARNIVQPMSDDVDKIRAVFGIPKHLVFIQTMLFWDLFHMYLFDKSTPMLWNYETSTGGHFRLYNEIMSLLGPNSTIMLDWSKFDKHVRHSIVIDLFITLRSYLDFDNGYVPTQNHPHTDKDWNANKALRIQRLWEYMVQAFFLTPVNSPDGKLYLAAHAGLPSGLFYTQVLDSMYNDLMIYTVLFKMGYKLESILLLKVLGDDSLFVLVLQLLESIHEQWLAQFATIALATFGAVLNVKKSGISNVSGSFEALSYECVRGLPSRDAAKLLASLYHSKSRSPTPEQTMAAALGIAYANFGQHARVHEVCKDIFEYYQRKGYRPSERALRMFTVHANVTLDEINFTTSFPTILDTQEYLLCMEYVSQRKNTVWPDYFKQD